MGVCSVGSGVCLFVGSGVVGRGVGCEMRERDAVSHMQHGNLYVSENDNNAYLRGRSFSGGLGC